MSSNSNLIVGVNEKVKPGKALRPVQRGPFQWNYASEEKHFSGITLLHCQ